MRIELENSYLVKEKEAFIEKQKEKKEETEEVLENIYMSYKLGQIKSE